MTREGYEKVPKKCDACGETIPFEKRENRYCSRSCSAKVNNRKRSNRLCGMWEKANLQSEEILFNRVQLEMEMAGCCQED